jgi:hypothetical protein
MRNVSGSVPKDDGTGWLQREPLIAVIGSILEAASQSAASAQQQTAESTAETPAQETSSVSQAARTMGSRMLWWVVPFALLLAAAAYWFLSRTMR